MQFDFSTVEDRDSFVTVPEGVYVCKIEEVRVGNSKDGSERWSLRLGVAEGKFAGRTAGWDSITWSERGIYRVKKVLEALGIEANGPVEIEHTDLVGLLARVQLDLEQWEDPLSGRTQIRLRVPYLGYSAVDGPAVELGVGAGAGGGDGESEESRGF
jgi:hypothetical protein